jgi:hypothetical protein
LNFFINTLKSATDIFVFITVRKKNSGKMGCADFPLPFLISFRPGLSNLYANRLLSSFSHSRDHSQKFKRTRSLLIQAVYYVMNCCCCCWGNQRDYLLVSHNNWTHQQTVFSFGFGFTCACYSKMIGAEIAPKNCTHVAMK